MIDRFGSFMVLNLHLPKNDIVVWPSGGEDRFAPINFQQCISLSFTSARASLPCPAKSSSILVMPGTQPWIDPCDSVSCDTGACTICDV